MMEKLNNGSANNSNNSNSNSSRRAWKLRCSLQNYDWGRIGVESGVGRLYSRNWGVEMEEEKAYAEFWMGTHPSGPSFVIAENGVSLNNWIQQNPHVLGHKVLHKWGTNLPFLFKVLSVAKALSIQAHPDKQFAEILHKSQPDVYKDDNHKPEMVLAVSEFEALCGFITLEELKGVLQCVPEISQVVGGAYADQVLNANTRDEVEKEKAIYKSIFTQLMSSTKEVISEAIAKLISRLNLKNKLTIKEELVLRLEKQYPDDVGVLASLLLNYVKLSPGEALFLGPNEPHAYLYGECIECMATSDNVVRAGLTPKKRDVETLCSMLSYKQGFPEILQGVPLNPNTRRYTPPQDEFEIDRCILNQGTTVVFPAIPGPSIILVSAGNGTMHSVAEDIVSEGDVLFTPANTPIIVTAASELHLYRAGVNSRIF